MKKLYTLAMAAALALSASAGITIGETSYETLSAAFDAAENGATITLSGTIEISSRLNLGQAKTLTLQGVDDATIKVNNNFTQSRILLNGASSNFTFKDITIDGGGFSSSVNGVELNQNNQHVTLDNVTFTNFNQTGGRIVLAKGYCTLKDVAFTNCTIADGAYAVVEGTNDRLTVAGTGNYKVGVESNYKMNASDFTGNIDLVVTTPSNRTVVVNGNVANFKLVNTPNYELVQNGTNIDLNYVIPVVFNETTQTSYTSITDALLAVTDNNEVLTVLTDCDWPVRVNSRSRSFTLQGKTGTEKITYTNTNGGDNQMMLENSMGFTLKNLIIDVNNKACKGNSSNPALAFKLTNAYRTVVLENITFLNVNNIHNDLGGYIANPQNLVATNVTIGGSAAQIMPMADGVGKGILIQNGGKATLNGNNNVPLYLSNGATVAVAEGGELTNTERISLVPAADYVFTDGTALVSNCSDLSKFDLATNEYHLEKDENGNLVLAAGEPTGIEAVAVEAEGEVEYYNLQGVRVAEPTTGLYIRRQGNKATKVLVK